MTKKCSTCGQTKPIHEFYRDCTAADGYRSNCASCHSTIKKRHYTKNRSVLLQGAFDNATPERKKKTLAYVRAYKKRNPEKHKAHVAVSRAIRSGKLTRKPCEVCGLTTVDAHHDDYSKPLDVRWLCFRHHQEHHGNVAILDYRYQRSRAQTAGTDNSGSPDSKSE